MESVSESGPSTLATDEASADSEPGPAVERDATLAKRLAIAADVVVVFALLLSSGAFLWLREVHELTFPAPWPDEGSFLWPALAFRDHSTLFAPELYPTREVLWMPPGFMVLEGCIFKLWTFSLGRARLLSALYLLATLLIIAWTLRRSRVRVGHAIVICIFLFSPIFQLAGNTARMETLLLLVASAGFAVLDRQRWAGLAVLACAPLVHPVGALFLAVGCVYWFAVVREKKPLTRVDHFVLGAAALAWGIYIVHIVPQFGVFYDDMAGQMKFKAFVSIANGGALSRLVEPLNLASLAGTIFAIATRASLGIRIEALAALALASLLASVFTEGWLYDIYAAFGAMVASLLVLEALAARTVRADQTRAGGLAKRALVVCVVLVVDAKAAVLDPFIMRSVKSSTVQAWNLEPTYLSADEHARVEAFLAGIAAENRQTKVQFLPDVDALLFEDSRGPSLGFVQQTFYASKPDVVVFHRTPWFPTVIRDLELMDIAFKNGIILPLGEWREIARGSSGVTWTVVRKLPGKIDWH